MSDLIKGIDVSVIQGNIDWQSVAAAGYAFVIVRCGVGNSGIDSNYSKNIAGAKAAGLKIACYNFIFPLPPSPSQPLRDPIKQSRYHFNASQGELAAIDLEWPAPQDFQKWSVSPPQLNQWMLAYLQEYTNLSNGRKPVIYTYPFWAAAVHFDPQFSQYPLWIASYEPTPTIPKPWNDWVIWQRSGGTEKLPNGVPVDVNVAKNLDLWNTAPTPVELVQPVLNIPLPPQQIASNPQPMPAPLPVPTNNSFNLWTTIIGLVNTFLSLFKRSN